MKIIKMPEVIKRFLPNSMVEVKGEVLLIDKMSGFIDAAENWVANELLSDALLVELANDNSIACFNSVVGIVACEAIKRAIPSLDLVLTANGFGVVSSGAVAPASHERVGRLIAEIELSRDEYIKSFINSMKLDSDFSCKWRNSSNGKKIGAILPYSLDLPIVVGLQKDIWKNYLGLRTRVIDIEADIAQNYISEEYMNELRCKNFGLIESSTADDLIISRLIAIIIFSLKNPDRLISDKLSTLVDFIRQSPDVYKTWATSNCAKIFNPVVFSNNQDSSAYFF